VFRIKRREGEGEKGWPRKEKEKALRDGKKKTKEGPCEEKKEIPLLLSRREGKKKKEKSASVHEKEKRVAVFFGERKKTD